jgi:hypothetical protein
VKPARRVDLPAADLRVGYLIAHEHLQGRVTRVERGPWTGIYLDGDPFRWLIPASTPVTVRGT